MIWLTWRQFRAQAAAVAAIAVAFALVLAATGPRLADLATTYRDVFDHITANDRHLFYAGIVVIAVAPVIIGVFWGAPLVARELEAGTHRLAWTQSVTRTRWLAIKLGVTAFTDAGKAWDFGSSMDQAEWHRGAGGGLFLIASVVRINLDIAHGLKTGDTKIHLSSGFTF